MTQVEIPTDPQPILNQKSAIDNSSETLSVRIRANLRLMFFL